MPGSSDWESLGEASPSPQAWRLFAVSQPVRGSPVPPPPGSSRHPLASNDTPLEGPVRPSTPAFKTSRALKTYENRKRKPPKLACLPIPISTQDDFFSSSPVDLVTQFPNDISSIAVCPKPIPGLHKIQVAASPAIPTWKKNPSTTTAPTSPVLRVVRAMAANDMPPESPHCIITLDDEEEEEGEIPDYKDLEEDHPSQECLLFKNESITFYDYQTLEEGEYINDSIINFYLTYLFEEKLTITERNQIHIFSTHFFTKLKQKPSKREGSVLSNAARSHEQVKKWTKKVDLFSKRIVVIPICEESHWYLILICNPGLIKYSKEHQIIHGNPFFLVFDSLGGNHSSDISKLRSYLSFELAEKHQKKQAFSRENMPEKEPLVPQQPNSCDCGIYLLQYVELIFKNPGQFYWSNIRDLDAWFSAIDVRHKREFLAKLIQELAIEANPNVGPFPKIKFARSLRSSKARKRNGVDRETEDDPPTTVTGARSSSRLPVKPDYKENFSEDDEGTIPTTDDNDADTSDDETQTVRNGRPMSFLTTPDDSLCSKKGIGLGSDNAKSDLVDQGVDGRSPSQKSRSSEGSDEACIVVNPLATAKSSPTTLNHIADGDVPEVEITITSGLSESEDASQISSEHPNQRRDRSRSNSAKRSSHKKKKKRKSKRHKRLRSSSDEADEDGFGPSMRKRSSRRVRTQSRKHDVPEMNNRRDRSRHRKNGGRKEDPVCPEEPGERAIVKSTRSLQVVVHRHDPTPNRTATHDPSRTADGFDSTNCLLRGDRDSDSSSSLFSSSHPKKTSDLKVDLETTFYGQLPSPQRPVGQQSPVEISKVECKPRKFRLQRNNL